MDSDRRIATTLFARSGVVGTLTDDHNTSRSTHNCAMVPSLEQRPATPTRNRLMRAARSQQTRAVERGNDNPTLSNASFDDRPSGLLVVWHRLGGASAQPSPDAGLRWWSHRQIDFFARQTRDACRRCLVGARRSGPFALTQAPAFWVGGLHHAFRSVTFDHRFR
jgi:hypothetical protein